MKKILASVFIIASLASCHYGQDEAKKTLERNENYKNEEAGFSVNRAGEYAHENKSEKKADTVAVIANDTAAAHADPATNH